MTYHLTCLALFAVSLCTITCANKYTKEVNKNWHEDEINPFKSMKVNQLWEKAKKVSVGKVSSRPIGPGHCQDMDCSTSLVLIYVV